MKKLLLIVAFNTSLFAFGQSTWVQKLSYKTQMGGYSDTLTGVKQIEIGIDGSIYMLAHIDAHNQQQIYKFSPNSNHLEWSIPVGYHAASGPQWAEIFKTTSDSGIIICSDHFFLTEPISGTVYKYSKDGNLEWSTYFTWNLALWEDRMVNDVIEKSPGLYDVLIEDSLFTLNDSGQVIDSTGAISGKKFIKATNGDLLILTSGNMIKRIDALGNLIWSTGCDGLFAFDTSSVFILTSGNIKKVDALSGAQLWNRNYGFSPISEIKPTHDGGFIASVGYKPPGMYGYGTGVVSPGYLFRADSLGDTVWTRMYALPTFGLSAFAIVPGGNLLTGGCYLSSYATGSWGDHSAFCCMMNSDGSYPLQQTHYVSPTDANKDYQSNFVEDALFTMLALGQTGIARDSSLDGHTGSVCQRRDIAIDWPFGTVSGINPKHSDHNGNGIVDTNDIHIFDYYALSGCADSAPVYYRAAVPSASKSIEAFCIVPVNDTIQPGEDALFYMILGNSANPVDSIYGFALSLFADQNGGLNMMNLPDFVYANNSDFGTAGTNLYVYFNPYTVLNSPWGFSRAQTMLCRTDFQNVYNVSDTVGIIGIASFTDSLALINIADFKAILSDGTYIPFTTCSEPIVVTNVTSVYEEKSTELKIFPNPANDRLTISHSFQAGSTVSIFNTLGEKIRILKTHGPQTEISVEELAEGFYTGTIASESGCRNFLFMKMRKE